MSGASGWKRTKLYEMKEDIDPHFAVGLQSFRQTANGFSYSQNSSEHNLGSRGTTWTYSYSKQHRSFLIDSIKSSSYSGDGQMPETNDISNFIKGERRKTVNCSGMASWAKGNCKSVNNAVTPMKKSEYTIKARKRSF